LKHYARFNQFFNLYDRENYQVRIVHPFDEIKTHDRDMVVPILASHECGNDEQALNYILNIKGRTILYASDTGWYCDQTWQSVESHKFDVVILECTYMKTKKEQATDQMLYTHLNVETFLKFIDRLRQTKSIDDKTQIFATHFNPYEITQEGISQLEDAGAKMAHRGIICEC
jgi:phosphoribosyl 1,2-cyclic phosphate phosphodiesterase